VEVQKNAPQLGIITEVGHRGVSSRNEDTGEGVQLLVGNRAEGTRVREVVLDLHLLDQLGFLQPSLLARQSEERHSMLAPSASPTTSP
jgi:hypothetical protein